ncbi:flavin reductase family protein [Sphingomonas gilva]|nr:flavin reductase family protein [Sphingomonas gilva]
MAASDLADNFRRAMRTIASTVHIVTIHVDGTPMGITATAVSSLAMEPPSLLVCINERAAIHQVIGTRTHFCVNALHRDDVELAHHFSDYRMRELRFRTGTWLTDGEGPPRLAHAQASIVCALRQEHRFGTHSIFIGEVESVAVREDTDPLVYLDGVFGGFGG